jgi:hypothetical protein
MFCDLIAYHNFLSCMTFTLKGHILDLLIDNVGLYFNIILYKRFSHTQIATVCLKLYALKDKDELHLLF